MCGAIFIDKQTLGEYVKCEACDNEWMLAIRGKPVVVSKSGDPPVE